MGIVQLNGLSVYLSRVLFRVKKCTSLILGEKLLKKHT